MSGAAEALRNKSDVYRQSAPGTGYRYRKRSERDKPDDPVRGFWQNASAPQEDQTAREKRRKHYRKLLARINTASWMPAPVVAAAMWAPPARPGQPSCVTTRYRHITTTTSRRRLSGNPGSSSRIQLIPALTRVPASLIPKWTRQCGLPRGGSPYLPGHGPGAVLYSRTPTAGKGMDIHFDRMMAGACF